MRALVLSSGGPRGHYHIGALRYLYKEKSVRHDIVCGTSIGAMLGAYLTQYPHGQEAIGLERLSELFLRTTNNHVYRKWRPLGYLHALFGKRSLYNSEPLRDLIDTNIDILKIQETGKKLRIGVTLLNPVYSKNKGFSNYKVYGESDPQLLQAIKASCALSPFFEPITLNEGIAVDGGVQTVTSIKSAIEAGATDIDVVVCYPTFLNYRKEHAPSVYNDALYVIDLMVNRLTWVDIERTRYVNSLVQSGAAPQKRWINLNVIHPIADLGVESLEFNRFDGERMQKQGWDDAKLNLK